MKRRLLAVSLFVLAAGCGNGTGPTGTVIHIRLVDDAARPAGPNMVSVTTPSGERIETRTGMNGTADIRVSGAGEYAVRIIPRAGYIPTSALSRHVSVGEDATAVLDFMLYREGMSTLPLPLYGN